MGVLADAARIALGVPPATRAITTPTLDSGSVLGGAALTWTSGGGLSLSRGEGEFDRCASALRAILLIAQNLASLDLLTIVGEEPDETDPIARLWNAGTPGAPYSAHVVREVLLARAELSGEAFAYVQRDAPGGPARGLHPIFGRVEPLRAAGPDEDPLAPRIVGYKVQAGSGTVPLLPDEVLWLRYPHPSSTWGALAPWKAALGGAQLDAIARKWQRKEFEAGARPSAVVYLGDLDRRAHDDAVSEYRRNVEGPDNAGKALLVSSGVASKVQTLGFTAAEMAFIESRQASTDEVLLGFGVNPDLVRAGSTYENRAAAKTALWSDTLLPKADTLASEIDRQLQPDPSRTTAWDLSGVDALRESNDALFARVRIGVESDVLTIDEGRAMLDLDPLPGGAGAVTLSVYRAREASPLPARAVLPPGRRRVIRHNRATITLARPRVRVSTRDRAGDAAAVLDAYDTHERVGQRAVARLAARQEKAVLRALRDLERKGAPLPASTARALVPLEGAPDDALVRFASPAVEGRMGADDLFDPVFWRVETSRALEDFMTGVFTDGGRSTARRLGVSFDVFDDRVLLAMQNRAERLADRVTETTRRILDGALLEPGVEAGESIPKLAARIKDVFADLSDWRAKMIARTETVGGFNASAHVVAASSGLVVRRSWLATKDARTRPSHVAADGEVLQGTEGVYSTRCRHPGDPDGPPAETIQCRCVELFDTEGEP